MDGSNSATKPNIAMAQLSNGRHHVGRHPYGSFHNKAASTRVTATGIVNDPTFNYTILPSGTSKSHSQ
jgi:hypothetical protein